MKHTENHWTTVVDCHFCKKQTPTKHSINNPENKSPRAILLIPLNKKTTIAITLKRLASVIRFTKISSYSG